MNRPLLCLLIVAGSLSGCVTPPGPLTLVPATDVGAVDEFRARARADESKGDLWAAKRNWQILLALREPSASEEIKTLERRIARRVRQLRGQARIYLDRRDYRSAKRSLLKALALEPEATDLQQMLRETEAKRAWFALARDPTRVEGSSQLADPTAGLPDAVVLKKPVTANSVQGVTDPSQAESEYRRGLRLFRKSPAEAREAFQNALAHDPNHPKAAIYLRRLQP
ncbi:MAG: hypothetical protein K0U93_29650 [Gammaproteobacteria bacterium]|nr:hypothetical protein [Gammaproteobacteria bacterium]